jgi:hypothetical protein
MAIMVLALCPARSRAQAALLMEEPYGFFGAVNPTGHTAIYFERVCAETPLKLRRCQPGEMGAVLSRYQGIVGYDWVAMPLLPYLYSIEKPSEMPAQVNRVAVDKLRDRYHEAHLLDLGEEIPRGGFLHGGWTELVGASYERRIYVFRFNTSEQQDDAFIASMNAQANRSRFSLLFNNCSDFARQILNFYFPGTFARSVFPDAGMTTPKHLAFRLVRYAHKHPETQLAVFEIPQVPGYRRLSRANKSIAESFVTTTGYVIPLAVLNPYVAGGLAVDYFARGRYRLIPKHPLRLGPDNLLPLTGSASPAQNTLSAEAPAASAALPADMPSAEPPNPGLEEIRNSHE